MRRQIGLLANVVVVVAFAACSSDTPTADPLTPPARTTQPPAPTEPSVVSQFIPGAISGDFKTQLESTWNLNWSGPQTGADGTYFDAGEAEEPDTGATLRAGIHGKNPTQISFFECRVEDGESAVIDGYLGFCASVPYDGAQPGEAGAWVKANASTVTTGNPKETKFGGIKFILLGDGSTFVTLQISALA